MTKPRYWWFLLLAAVLALAYKHPHCDRAHRSQFQFPDCYIPAQADSILFHEASFLMSHDAATGYIRPGDRSKQGLAWSYAKNQVGSVYQQLNDGARALDLRPKLLGNGTIIFQHGSLINIPVTFEQVVSEAVQWCGESNNKDELVLLLPSNFLYQYDSSSSSESSSVATTMYSAMKNVYNKFGVTYLHCNEVYGLTLGQVKELSLLASGGYLLALDGQDYGGTFCGKSNWIKDQIVTCWGSSSNSSRGRSCRTSQAPLQDLFAYVLASSNNPSTNDVNTLGPPIDRYNYPLNEIQALWQVDTRSAAIGLAHFSSILEDNRQSQVNRHMVELIYSGQFEVPISIFAVDNVVLNGNALLSVLRTACGQSDLDVCGSKIEAPRITYVHLSTRQLVRLCLSVYLVWFVIWLGLKLKNSRLQRTFVSKFQRQHRDVSYREQSHENPKTPTLSWRSSSGLLT
jgi:hypothetical protein